MIYIDSLVDQYIMEVFLFVLYFLCTHITYGGKRSHREGMCGGLRSHLRFLSLIILNHDLRHFISYLNHGKGTKRHFLGVKPIKVLCGGLKTTNDMNVPNWNLKIAYKGPMWWFKEYITILDPKVIQIGPRGLMFFSYLWSRFQIPYMMQKSF